MAARARLIMSSTSASTLNRPVESLIGCWCQPRGGLPSQSVTSYTQATLTGHPPQTRSTRGRPRCFTPLYILSHTRTQKTGMVNLPARTTLAISAENLENDPVQCLQVMLYAEQKQCAVNFSAVACQRNWRSSFVSSLVMLVGKLDFDPIFPFYGFNSTIEDDIGLKLLQVALRLGADVRSVDGVGQTPVDLLTPGLITSRKNNTKFKRYLVCAVVADKVVTTAISNTIAALRSEPQRWRKP